MLLQHNIHKPETRTQHVPLLLHTVLLSLPRQWPLRQHFSRLQPTWRFTSRWCTPRLAPLCALYWKSSLVQAAKYGCVHLGLVKNVSVWLRWSLQGNRRHPFSILANTCLKWYRDSSCSSMLQFKVSKKTASDHKWTREHRFLGVDAAHSWHHN